MKRPGELGAERREMRPLLLNVGVALFLSLAGFFYGHLWSRGDRPRRGRQPQNASGAGIGGEKEAGRDEEELPRGQSEEEASSNMSFDAPSTVKRAASPTSGTSPCSKNFGDEEYLLPEFNELLLQEFESFGLEPNALEASPPDRSLQNIEEKVSEKEIVALKNLARLLQERVESLEIQLLEYYGLKEQESTVHELENRLKLTTMEAKLLSLKAESLKAENQKLAAQVSNHSRVKAELELAWAKIKNLERKLQSDSLQANENVSELHRRITALKERECRGEEDTVQLEEKLKHLDEEATALRSENSKLLMETSDLAKKLSTQFVASSVPKSTEVAELLEEASRLRETNDKLNKEIAQLQIDRCADVEELVYLRWINACLRYELRNYHPPPGKHVARDLSNTLSPRSEQKAKQLILEYANSGINEKCVSLMDFDSEYCFSSQSSSLTEYGEVDDSLADATSSKDGGSNKTKFLRKLKRLVGGKDAPYIKKPSRDGSPRSCGTLERRASVSGCSIDDVLDRSSYDSVASCITLDNTPGNQLLAVEEQVSEQKLKGAPWTKNLSRVSLDFQRLKSREEFGNLKGERSKSDVGSSYWRMMNMGDESFLQSPPNLGVDQETFDLSELEYTFGNASKSPRGKLKVRSRCTSCS